MQSASTCDEIACIFCILFGCDAGAALSKHQPFFVEPLSVALAFVVRAVAGTRLATLESKHFELSNSIFITPSFVEEMASNFKYTKILFL